MFVLKNCLLFERKIQKTRNLVNTTSWVCFAFSFNNYILFCYLYECFYHL